MLLLSLTTARRVPSAAHFPGVASGTVFASFGHTHTSKSH